MPLRDPERGVGSSMNYSLERSSCEQCRQTEGEELTLVAEADLRFEGQVGCKLYAPGVCKGNQVLGENIRTSTHCLKNKPYWQHY